MLAHTPPLPLVIGYQYRDITAKDEEAIILALQKQDRIRFDLPILKLQKLITAMDGHIQSWNIWRFNMNMRTMKGS